MGLEARRIGRLGGGGGFQERFKKRRFAAPFSLFSKNRLARRTGAGLGPAPEGQLEKGYGWKGKEIQIENTTFPDARARLRPP